MGQGKRSDNEKAARLSGSLDRTLAALADPSRRKAIDLIRKKPRSAGELAAALGLPAATMSRHLRQLRISGLVTETHPEFDARVRIYSLKSGAIAELREWASRAEALWTDELKEFKAHVEKERT